MQLIRYNYGDNRYYYFWPALNTNATLPNVTFGSYYVTSPGYPTNGATALYQFDTNGFNLTGGGAGGFNVFDAPDFNSSFIQSLTNGQWSLYVTNTTTTNVYHFTVTANINSNALPDVVVTFPTNGAVNVPSQPTFTWQGPTNYSQLVVYQDNNSAVLPVTQTNLSSPWVLNEGTNHFNPNYQSNSATAVISSTPVDSLSHLISSWVSTSKLQTYFTSEFVVGLLDTSGGSHTLVAHYPFDAASGPVLNAATDSSGNGFDMTLGGGFGAQGGANMSANSQAGAGAVQFHDGDFASGGFLGWTDPTPPELLSALAGSFSVSCWIKTTQNLSYEGAPADQGAGIVSADASGLANDCIPIALTGSEIAFNTGGATDQTLSSKNAVNDGNYHHIVVTRNQQTGQKIIYIDGQLDNWGSGTTNLLTSPQKLTIGSLADAGNPDPNDGSYYNGYDGLLDDLQIYSGVLSMDEVNFLFNNPGAIVTNRVLSDFGTALGTSGLTWETSGDSNWFIESTNTHNGAPFAAQSGSVTGSQSSTLFVTVTGPATLTFAWSSIAEDPNGGFDYEFYIDDPFSGDVADLFGDNAWQTYGPVIIPAGQHTLGWVVFANGDTDPAQAGFLDNVSFIPDTVPVITVNPFNQTNYPGYPVWLSAAATSNPTATWQWYKVGSGVISGATNSYFIPTNSGNGSVIGNYYAIASTPAGSAVTTTAAVSFASAALPPDWSRAFKSPFLPVDNSTVTRDYYYGCLVDGSGNLYVAAEFGGNTTVGSSNLNSGTGGDAAAIIKESQTGTPIWAVAITNNGSGNSYAECVASAPNGGVYLAGNYSGDNWLRTNKLTDAGGGDFFVCRFDANGSNLWTKTFGGTNTDFIIINSLASDPSGNVTVCGLLGDGPVTIGTNNYNVTGQQGVIIQLDSNGTVRWSQILPSEFGQYLVYSVGRLYVSMNTEITGGTTNVVVGGVSNLTDRAWAVACLNETNGQAIWVRGVGAVSGSRDGNPLAGAVIDDVPRLAVSGTNLFITGVAYNSSASFGATTVNFDSLRGEYFVRCDTNGNAQIATTYGSVTLTPNAVAADANGNLYVSGVFDNFAYFGQDLIGAPDNARLFPGAFSQSFLAKFDINGNPLWAREAIAPATVNFLGIALDSDGIWASGWCSSSNATGGILTGSAVLFGTNSVFSDAQVLVGGPGGSTAFIWYPAGVLAKITEGTAPPIPVTLINPQRSGVNFQFSFVSTVGHTNTVESRTNLALGSWQFYTNFAGDGSLKTVLIPATNPPVQFFRVRTQ